MFSLWNFRYSFLFFESTNIFSFPVKCNKTLSLLSNNVEIIIEPSSLKDINPLSNKASWIEHNKRTFSLSSFSNLLDFAQGLIWLVINSSLFLMPQISQHILLFNKISLKSDWPTLNFEIIERSTSLILSGSIIFIISSLSISFLGVSICSFSLSNFIFKYSASFPQFLHSKISRLVCFKIFSSWKLLPLIYAWCFLSYTS